MNGPPSPNLTFLISGACLNGDRAQAGFARFRCNRPPRSVAQAYSKAVLSAKMEMARSTIPQAIVYISCSYKYPMASQGSVTVLLDTDQAQRSSRPAYLC